MIIFNKRDSLFWKSAEYLLYAFFCFFPFINFNSFLYGGTSSRSVVVIFLATVLGIAFAIQLFKKDSTLSFSKSPIFISVAVYLIFIVISGISGLNFGTSFWSLATRTDGIWYLASLGFIAYMFWALISDRSKQNKLILSVIISTALFSILSFLGPEGLGWIFRTYSSDGFTFGNSTFAGMYILGAFLLSIYYLVQSENRKWWIYALPLLIVANPNIISMNEFIGEARASAYSIIIGIITLIVFWGISKIKEYKIKKITVYALFFVSVTVLFFSAFSLLSPSGYLREIYLSTTKDSRPIVWEMSERVISQKPYLGWGTSNFERAFEANYDNRVLQDEYGSEAWFDRAHNIFIDQLVDNGLIGLLLYTALYIVIVLSLIYVTLKSTEKKDRLFASILIAYFSLHLIELQTSFDTTISYPLLVLMVAFSAVLFDRTIMQVKKKENEYDIGSWFKYSAATVLIAFLGWSFIYGLMPFVKAQIANKTIRTIGSAEGRIVEYEKLFDSPIDKHSFLWRMSTDFQKAIGQNPQILEDGQKVSSLKKEIVVFENAYRDYIKENPQHFRAHLNLADMLIYQRLFGIDKLKEAQEVLDEAIKMVPQAPQAYWMKAVAYIYMKKFDLAREYAQKGLALNPKIIQSQDVVKYVEKSIKDFPNIDLYFFKQI